MRWLPDWLIYLLALSVVLLLIFRKDERFDAPEAPPSAIMEDQGVPLPPPSAFDEAVLVDVGPQTLSSGTAFAINRDGWWLTARHVVDGCAKVQLVVAPGAAAPVRDVRTAATADVALLRTDRAPQPLEVAPPNPDLIDVGDSAYHIGYPQGQPGEAASRLLGRQKLIARGRYNTEEGILAWSETGRTRGLYGTLGGLSGGPALDEKGRVIGVTIAESPRRGRIYTSSPESLARFLAAQGADLRGARPVGAITPENYGAQGDRLRRELAVAKVICTPA
jgi:serine protease Do